MEPAAYGLAPMVYGCCYYTLRNRQSVENKIYTTYNKVFRNERSNIDSLDRLTTFSVRDIVFVGDSEFVLHTRQRLIDDLIILLASTARWRPPTIPSSLMNRCTKTSINTNIASNTNYWHDYRSATATSLSAPSTYTKITTAKTSTSRAPMATTYTPAASASVSNASPTRSTASTAPMNSAGQKRSPPCMD